MTATKIRPVQATAPERIYLQGGPQLPPETEFEALSEVTWCRDDVDGTGIPYVRADLAGAAPAAVAPEHPPMPETWAVVASIEGQDVVCISSNALSGKGELTESEEQAVIGMAQHLLAFVGYGLPPCDFDADDEPAPAPALEAPAAPAEWQIEENTGMHGHAAGFYVCRKGYAGDQWMQDEKRRIARFATRSQAVAAIAAAAPQAPAAPALGRSAAQAVQALQEMWDDLHRSGSPRVNVRAMRYYSDALSTVESALLAAPAAPAVDAPAKVLSQAARDVLAERRRQIDVEGWTPEHDDEHRDGAMSIAAACYTLAQLPGARPYAFHTSYLWTWTGWGAQWFKPRDRRHNLVKAAALNIAELERLDRVAAQTKEGGA
ncbi:MAG: hypothetical protein GAK34_01096 [Delftia tsuruhatensis]|nr:MAG: hypothetical protein GAK34_01096 [Delftia tsuruhatensis]